MRTKYKINAGYIFIILSIIFLFLSVRMFYAGIHNVDLVHNYQKLALEMNPYLAEANITMVNTNKAMDDMGGENPLFLDGVYSLGTNQEEMGLGLMFFSGFLFSLGILLLNSPSKPKTK